MNFEKPLNEEEAHDEANALRVEANVSAKTGQVVSFEQGSRVEREATAEDYEAASKAIDDLKELAQKDPTAFERFMKYGNRGAMAVMLPFGILGTIYSEMIVREKGVVQGVREDINFAKEYFTSDQPFTEAQRRLKGLQDEAQRFAEGEKQKPA